MTQVLLAHSFAHPAAAALLADDDTDKGSPIGLFVVLVLIVAVYFLYRSMNKHMRRLPASFDPPEPPTSTEPPTSIEPPTPSAAVRSAAVPVPDRTEAGPQSLPASTGPNLTKAEPGRPTQG